jgi:NAD(P)H-dependent FMN reductase
MTDNSSPLRIAIILGSTRPGRKSEVVGRWVYELAKGRSDAIFEIVDLKEIGLPLYDEAIPPSAGKYAGPHTRAWAAKVASYDAYVLVTPEYNHGMSAVLKNALDFVSAEWHNKAAGFVSYGSSGGVRAVEQLRVVLAELQVATVRQEVPLSLITDFESYTTFKPDPGRAKLVGTMLDQLVLWGRALRTVRTPSAA